MYQNCEEYMRSVLGYPVQCPMDNTYKQEMPYYNQNMVMPTNQNLEELYPDIYRIVNPMVCKICDSNRNKPITEEMIEEMTNTIYINVENNMEVEVNTREEVKNGDVKNPNVKEEKREERRQNFLLRDLIRILILRNLLGNNAPFRPNMPPNFNPGGMMPPPFMPGPRPPMYQNRDFYSNY